MAAHRTRWLEIDACAKVNLGLAVIRRREDGFHDIDTIFQTTSLCDSLRLEGPEPGSSIVTTGHPVTAGDDNLALRAARLLESAAGCPPVHIELEKRIPVAAGLGGGSSDAAATLLGLNSLFELGLSSQRLELMALELGSDVPFLLSGGTARGRGRGELLTRLPALSGVWLALVTPRAQVSAALGYAHARIGLTQSERSIRLSCSAIQEGRAERLMSLLHNDLEAGVVSCCPDAASARSSLERAGARAVVMSGSGPTVVGLASSEEEALGIASRLTGRDFEIHVAHPTAWGSRVRARGAD